MDEDGLPIVGSGVDLTKVPGIQQKRVVAFLNQFIVHTVRFLNRFSTVCEEKLANVSLRIQQIETTLSILEAKLSSIPGLETVTVEGACPPTQASADVNGSVMMPSSQSEVPAAPSSPEEAGQQPRTEAPKDNVLTVAKDSRYARYLKMVQVAQLHQARSTEHRKVFESKTNTYFTQGVPVMAIKNKMVQEGLDPSLLDTPDAPVPDAGKATEEADDNSSDSESSFSD